MGFILVHHGTLSGRGQGYGQAVGSSGPDTKTWERCLHLSNTFQGNKGICGRRWTPWYPSKSISPKPAIFSTWSSRTSSSTLASDASCLARWSSSGLASFDSSSTFVIFRPLAGFNLFCSLFRPIWKEREMGWKLCFTFSKRFIHNSFRFDFWNIFFLPQSFRFHQRGLAQVRFWDYYYDNG